MAVIVKNRKGKEVRLLNPSEKARKFATELHEGCRFTNDGIRKTDKNGEIMRFTDTQKSYRSGYLQARKDNAKAYKSKKK